MFMLTCIYTTVVSACNKTLLLWGWFNNLYGTIQWSAFIFNRTIAFIYIRIIEHTWCSFKIEHPLNFLNNYFTWMLIKLFWSKIICIILKTNKNLLKFFRKIWNWIFWSSIHSLAKLLTACSLNLVLCLNPYPVKYQTCAPRIMIVRNQQTLSWAW